jgi:hypothetical protein
MVMQMEMQMEEIQVPGMVIWMEEILVTKMEIWMEGMQEI